MAFSQSRRHCTYLLVGHGVLLLLILVLSLPPSAQALLLLGLLGHGAWIYKHLRKQTKITHLLLEGNQFLVVLNGQKCNVQGFVPVFVSAWLAILRFDHEGRRFWMPIWPDSVDAEQFRQLRVWLLCGKWRRD